MEIWIVFVLAVGVTFGGLGAWVAGQRRRDGLEGFLLGSLFGPLGVLIECLLPAGRPAAPASAGPTSTSPPPAPLPARILPGAGGDWLDAYDRRLGRVSIRCPGCGVDGTVPTKMVGRTVRCTCSAELHVRPLTPAQRDRLLFRVEAERRIADERAAQARRRAEARRAEWAAWRRAHPILVQAVGLPAAVVSGTLLLLAAIHLVRLMIP